ncbi:lysophosphatidic acid receptor 6 [Esox lucius]|uniref:G-protein coupled receptors family 1 profile domain-containing protein n=1 Tax=Esox lucius TaxID=8010 RepID=A0A3P8XYR9_ESOLU|nr:lysophosphatidic acid receptor 6 [Esox lucius]
MNTTSNCTQHDLIFVGVYATVFTVGLLLNTTALVIFCCSKSRSHTTVYMTHLAIADLLLVLTLPLRIYHHLGFKDLPQILCDGVAQFLLINMYGSIFLLTCICFDRCMAVCFPMSSRVREGRKKAPLVCLGVWVLTIGASLPGYLLRKKNAQLEGNCFGKFPLYAKQPLVVASILIVGFGVPLVVMFACSWALNRAITRSSVAQTDLIDSGKIQRMIAISLLIFLTCFLPYHVTLTVLYVHGEAESCPLLLTFRYSLMVACLNAMLDPLAYYFTKETFRNKVDLDVFRRMFPLNSQTSSTGNNRGSKAAVNT